MNSRRKTSRWYERVKADFGLASAYTIVQDHGGKIEMESEAGKGTVAAIYLPVKKKA